MALIGRAVIRSPSGNTWGPDAAGWSDARLREAALDETLRYAMLGAAVASAAAQRAWADYWSAHLSGFGEPETDEGIRARFASRQPLRPGRATA